MPGVGAAIMGTTNPYAPDYRTWFRSLVFVDSFVSAFPKLNMEFTDLFELDYAINSLLYNYDLTFNNGGGPQHIASTGSITPIYLDSALTTPPINEQQLISCAGHMGSLPEPLHFNTGVFQINQYDNAQNNFSGNMVLEGKGYPGGGYDFTLSNTGSYVTASATATILGTDFPFYIRPTATLTGYFRLLAESWWPYIVNGIPTRNTATGELLVTPPPPGI